MYLARVCNYGVRFACENMSWESQQYEQATVRSLLAYLYPKRKTAIRVICQSLFLPLYVNVNIETSCCLNGVKNRVKVWGRCCVDPLISAVFFSHENDTMDNCPWLMKKNRNRPKSLKKKIIVNHLYQIYRTAQIVLFDSGFQAQMEVLGVKVVSQIIVIPYTVTAVFLWVDWLRALVRYNSFQG